MTKVTASLATILMLALAPADARAAEPEAEAPAGDEAGAEGSVSLSGDGLETDGKTKKKKKKKKDDGTKWIKRYRPERNMMEVGIFGGIILPPAGHELYRPDNTMPPGFGHQPYNSIAPDIGLRFGYYPLSFLGLEVEGNVMPTKVADGTGATMFGFRGYALGQLPYRIAPFALIGFGMLGASSDALGTDIDPALHFGGGVKFFVNRWLSLRLDVRDNVSAAHQIENGRTNYVEILLGLSITLNRKKAEEPVELIDTDGDGLYDPGQGQANEDECPNTPGPIDNKGCPEYDRDGDGFFDNQDACPDVPGVAPDGCPESDRDGDGFLDSRDACPDVPGVEPDGCPIPDTDNDGILDPDDKCVTEPETVNGFEDEDGCPDEIPVEVAKFTGSIRGVHFGGGPTVAPGTIQPTQPHNRESYGYNPDNPYIAVADDPLSTFAADVDTASYSNVR
ncbi:MAG: VWA domain-containing protein, partial [Nannocystaceae bacterium]